MSGSEKLKHIKPIKSKRGTFSKGKLKLSPIINEIINRIEPPINVFNAVINMIFLLLLRNLLKIVSILQKKDADITRILPIKFWLKDRF